MAIEVSQNINRPVDQVFEYVTHMENNPEWEPAVLEVTKTSEGPIAVGTVFRQGVRAMGKQGVVNLEITEYEPNERFGFRALNPFGPIQPRSWWTFEQADEETKITFVADPNPRGLFKIMSPLISWWATRLWTKNFATLKQVLESSD